MVGCEFMRHESQVSRYQMIPRDLRNIHTTRNSSRDTLPSANMALKLLHYFYSLMEKPHGRYLQVWSSYCQTAQCNQKTPIPVSLWSQVRSKKTRKGEALILITATNNVHLPKSVSTDLTTKQDSVLTNPIGKDGVHNWSM